MLITAKDLKNVGFKDSRALGLALEHAKKEASSLRGEDMVALLKQVLENPAAFAEDEKLKPLVSELMKKSEYIPLTAGKPYTIFGGEAIEQGALDQMETAMRLPVAVAGALMPDAHQGYGLPIGGVLATTGAVIPYGVGVDIGCRMCMTIYDLPVSILEEKKERIKKLLLQNSRFGLATFENPMEHEVIDRREFAELEILRELKDGAWKQLGSSGGGNHFVEFGMVEIRAPLADHNLAARTYVGVLSHSGSRGLGANIARHYTKIAMETCKLPSQAKHLAWLDLDSEAGQEYWLAMNLAGDYASACHHQIHKRMAAALGQTPLARVENHHNFAWKEKDSFGNEFIVHRKGATPAAAGVFGIIPGSMATPGFIVEGRGEVTSLNSASHGAGRTMSRTKAKQTILPGQVRKALKHAGVELIGSGVDEAPMAYKDIHRVMEYQKHLVEVKGSFMPRIVRMCGDERFKEVD